MFSTSIPSSKLINNTISIYADGNFLYQRSYNCSQKETDTNSTDFYKYRCDPRPILKDCIEISGDERAVSAFECFSGYSQWHIRTDYSNVTIQVRHESDVTIQNFISQNNGDLSQLGIPLIALLIVAVL
eukprot:NODE_948_length_2940_cov_0.351989.p3 type:complete len:129 gc:universal NODE_948_length_2940_cov_0.351989:760-1146(+)